MKRTFSIILPLFLLLAVAFPVYAADQCPGETTEADAACASATSGTICCVVRGQDNQCMTTSACISAQANAADPTAPTTPSNTQTSPTDNTQTAPTPQGTFANPLKAGDLSELLTAVLRGIVQIGAILLVLALVWVGFLFVAAQGAEEKIRDARNALFWTVVGGLILLGATAISEVIGATVERL